MFHEQAWIIVSSSYWITSTSNHFGPWNISNPSLNLPRRNKECDVGYNPLNNTIILLGGGHSNTLVDYTLNQDKVIIAMHDYGTSFTEQWLGCGGQTWAQHGNRLYLFPDAVFCIIWIYPHKLLPTTLHTRFQQYRIHVLHL